MSKPDSAKCFKHYISIGQHQSLDDFSSPVTDPFRHTYSSFSSLCSCNFALNTAHKCHMREVLSLGLSLTVLLNPLWPSPPDDVVQKAVEVTCRYCAKVLAGWSALLALATFDHSAVGLF